ncbi:hypothetical protein CEXT_207491 [Caerostris extrusa]|uniref:Uncharacterized protein n=1 Tax=Caerostris extrusa TaxID=172846 RepID=A0AAV4UAJ8_CAEEX|nr:hypothetical protein CEXT_207491 [Caerostris extrusa]
MVGIKTLGLKLNKRYQNKNLLFNAEDGDDTSVSLSLVSRKKSEMWNLLSKLQWHNFTYISPLPTFYHLNSRHNELMLCCVMWCDVMCK